MSPDVTGPPQSLAGGHHAVSFASDVGLEALVLQDSSLQSVSLSIRHQEMRFWSWFLSALVVGLGDWPWGCCQSSRDWLAGEQRTAVGCSVWRAGYRQFQDL